MDPQFFLTAVVTIIIAAIGTSGAVKIAKVIAQSRTPRDPDTAARLQALEQEVSVLRQEMVEEHERLEFAERVLAQRSETRRVEPQR